jgi:hypothetical protein
MRRLAGSRTSDHRRADCRLQRIIKIRVRSFAFLDIGTPGIDDLSQSRRTIAADRPTVTGLCTLTSDPDRPENERPSWGAVPLPERRGRRNKAPSWSSSGPATRMASWCRSTSSSARSRELSFMRLLLEGSASRFLFSSSFKNDLHNHAVLGSAHDGCSCQGAEPATGSPTTM